MLRKFYKAAYKIIRKHSGEETKVIISDSFHPERWLRFAKTPPFNNVVLDIHLYQGFSPSDKRAGLKYHLQKASYQKTLISNWQRHIPVMIGEWSLGSGRTTFANLGAVKKQELLRRYSDSQIKSYDTAAAWFFWSYKMEHKNNWNFRHLVELGIIGLS